MKKQVLVVVVSLLMFIPCITSFTKPAFADPKKKAINSTNKFITTPDEWAFKSDRDPITDDTNVLIGIADSILTPINVLQLQCLRREFEVTFSSSYMLGYDLGSDATVRIRFDDAAHEKQEWTLAGQKKNVIFSPSPVVFLSRLLKAKRLLVEFYPPGAPSVLVKYDVKNLQHFLPMLKASCPDVAKYLDE